MHVGDLAFVGQRNDDVTNSAAWRKKVISYIPEITDNGAGPTIDNPHTSKYTRSSSST